MADFLAVLGFENVITRFMPALLVLLFTYGILEYTGLFGKNKLIDAMVAFVLAAIFLASAKTSAIIAFMAPWFVVLFVFILFVIMAFKAMGVADSAIISTVTTYKPVVWSILVLALIIALFGLGGAMGQDLLNQQSGASNQDNIYNEMQANQASAGSTGTSNYNQNLTSTLFNAKIVGLFFLGLIATFTVFFMTSSAK